MVRINLLKYRWQRFLLALILFFIGPFSGLWLLSALPLEFYYSYIHWPFIGLYILFYVIFFISSYPYIFYGKKKILIYLLIGFLGIEILGSFFMLCPRLYCGPVMDTFSYSGHNAMTQ